MRIQLCLIYYSHVRMESNLFPVFLIGFLLIIVFLLTIDKSTVHKPNSKHRKISQKSKPTKTQQQQTQKDEEYQQAKTKLWHKNIQQKQLQYDTLFSNQWQNQFKEYNLNNNSNSNTVPSVLALG